MKLPEFPKELKRDSVSVVIYKTPSKGNDTFTLSYYQEAVGGGNTATNIPPSSNAPTRSWMICARASRWWTAR
jgi:hypothetical protein